MSNLLTQLDELSTTAQMQINTLKAVESAFRTDCEEIDKDAFAYPINGLCDTLQTLSSIVCAMFAAVRAQEAS